MEAALLTNSRTALALFVLLASTIALCQTTPTEAVPQESQPTQHQNEIRTQNQNQPLAQQSPTTTNPAPPQGTLPAAPSSVIDPNAETLHQTPRIMGILPNFTPPVEGELFS